MPDYIRVGIIRINSTSLDIVDHFDSSPETMESLVGRVMDVRSLGSDMLLWVNNEGQYNDLPMNLSLVSKTNGSIIEVVRGNVIVTSSNEDGDVLGLSHTDVDELSNLFEISERYSTLYRCTKVLRV